jgi:hypothetical protein
MTAVEGRVGGATNAPVNGNGATGGTPISPIFANMPFWTLSIVSRRVV